MPYLETSPSENAADEPARRTEPEFLSTIEICPGVRENVYKSGTEKYSVSIFTVEGGQKTPPLYLENGTVTQKWVRGAGRLLVRLADGAVEAHEYNGDPAMNDSQVVIETGQSFQWEASPSGGANPDAQLVVLQECRPPQNFYTFEDAADVVPNPHDIGISAVE